MTPEKQETRPVIMTSVTDDGEVLVTMPDGRMTFMGFVRAARFAFLAMLKGYDVRVEK